MLAYLITNKDTKKSYVGITTRDLHRRWYEHRLVANSCGKLLAKAIKKYGEDSFEVMELATPIQNSIQALKELEKLLIEQNNTLVPNGYNLTEGGDGVFGYKHTDESKEKMSISRTGKKASSATRLKMHIAHSGENNAFYGKAHSNETKEKISSSKKTNPNRHWLGKPRDEETKRKISESLKLRNKLKGI